jgi:hypothetical protein
VHHFVAFYQRLILVIVLGLTPVGGCFAQMHLNANTLRQLTIADGLPSNYVYHCAQDKDGYLWFATDNGICKYDGTRFTVLDMRHGLYDNDVIALGITDSFVLALTLRGTNVVYGNAVSTRFNNMQCQVMPRVKTEMQIDDIFVSMSDSQSLVHNLRTGQLLLRKKGMLAKQDIASYCTYALPELSLFTQYNRRLGVFTAYNFATNYYVVSDTNGVTKASIYCGLEDMNSTIQIIDSALWKVCSPTLIEVSRFGQSGSQMLDLGHLKAHINSAFEDNQGNIYICTRTSGVFVLKPTPNIFSTATESTTMQKLQAAANFPLSPVNGKCIAQYDQQTFVVGAGDGVLVVDKNCPSNYRRIFDVRTYAIAKTAKGAVLFGTLQGLYYRQDLEANTTTQRITLNDSSACTVLDISIDEAGRTWVCTAGFGVQVLDKNLQVQKVYGKHNGLLSDACKKLRIDAKGRVWVASDAGISIIDQNKLSYLTAADGLKVGYIQDLQITGDTCLIITDQGTQLFVHKPKKGLIEIPLLLFSCKINSAQVETIPAVLNAKERDLALEFSGLYFAAPKEIVYKYRLLTDGTGDLPWTISTTGNITFANLAAASYTLEVQAIHNVDSTIQSKVLQYRFTIKPHFYQTTLFIVFATVLLCGLVGLGIFSTLNHRRRIATQSRDLENSMNLYRLKSLQGQMNPHFIFNSLSTLQNLLLHENAQSAIAYLGEFSKLLRQMLSNSRKDELSLIKEIDFIKQYVNVEQIRYKNAFKVHFNIDVPEELIDELNVPTMLLQPLVENAIKHAMPTLVPGEGIINISAKYIAEQEQLLIEVLDNGKTNSSTKNNNTTESVALQVIAERLALLKQKTGKHASFSLQTSASGTSATLSLPV